MISYKSHPIRSTSQESEHGRLELVIVHEPGGICWKSYTATIAATATTATIAAETTKTKETTMKI